MKNIKLLSLLFSTVLMVTACDSEGFNLFDADATLSKSVDIDIPEDTPVKSITFNKTFDATTEPELEKFVDRIDSYTIDSISYSIENYTGEPATLTEGTISIESEAGEVLGSVTLSNVDIQALNDAGKQLLDFTDEEFKAIANALKNDNIIDLNISGTIDNDPVAFTLTTHLDLKVSYRIFD